MRSLLSAQSCRPSLTAANSWMQVQGTADLCIFSALNSVVEHFTENPLLPELKELNSSLTTEEMVAETKELKAENSGYKTRLEKIKSATNHVTPEEKEKVKNNLL